MCRYGRLANLVAPLHRTGGLCADTLGRMTVQSDARRIWRYAAGASAIAILVGIMGFETHEGFVFLLLGGWFLMLVALVGIHNTAKWYFTRLVSAVMAWILGAITLLGLGLMTIPY